MENVMSIGNGGNDVDMLEMSGYGVAVGNSEPEAKAVADYICPPQSEDGASEAIERILLKG